MTIGFQPYCDRPEDCPNGPGPHQFSPPQNLMCCCRQTWEDTPSAPVLKPPMSPGPSAAHLDTD